MNSLVSSNPGSGELSALNASLLLKECVATKLSPHRDKATGAGFAEAPVEIMTRNGIIRIGTSAIAIHFSVLQRVLAMFASCATVLFS